MSSCNRTRYITGELFLYQTRLALAVQVWIQISAILEGLNSSEVFETALAVQVWTHILAILERILRRIACPATKPRPQKQTETELHMVSVTLCMCMDGPFHL